MKARLPLSVLFGTLLMYGCISVSDYPEGWAPQLAFGDWCGGPLGVFANAPRATTEQDDDVPLTLTEVVIGTALTGSEVTTVEFARAKRWVTVVTPGVGERPANHAARYSLISKWIQTVHFALSARGRYRTRFRENPHVTG